MYEPDEDNDVLEEIPSETEDRETDVASYKLMTYGADYTLTVLVDKIKDHEIIVPPFQRKFVWSLKTASRLIESFLLGLPVPQIFLYREEDTQGLLVVDGQQRLKTILFFFDGKFDDGRDFYLRSVNEKWEGKKYSDLTEPDKRRLKDSILRTTIFQQTDPRDDSSIFEVFERLNSGGTTLKEQEIRNCIIRGNINNFLDSLNSYTNWRRLYRKDESDGRMRDIELILRFLALYENLDGYSKPMKGFLTNFMRENKDLSESDQKRYSELFKETMDFIYEEIGESAFRIKAGVNAAVFDAISVALARADRENIPDVKDRYENLLAEDSFLGSVSQGTTDKDRVNHRINMAIEAFSR